MIMVLHFGSFHLLSCAWRGGGSSAVDALAAGFGKHQRVLGAPMEHCVSGPNLSVSVPPTELSSWSARRCFCGLCRERVDSRSGNLATSRWRLWRSDHVFCSARTGRLCRTQHGWPPDWPWARKDWELASGSGLARGFCSYVAVFWGVRLLLQGVLDVKEHLGTSWLKLGYGLLTVFFAYFTVVYTWAAFGPAT